MPDAYVPSLGARFYSLDKFFNRENDKHLDTADEIKISLLNNLPNFNFENVGCYIERGDPNFLVEAPDKPLMTTIRRAPTIQEEVELGGL